MLLTAKQRQILTVLIDANRDDGGNFESWCDIDQLLDRLPYDTSKQSMQFSIRALINKKLVVKGDTELARGRKRRQLIPTNLAVSLIKPAFKVTPDGDND